MSLDRKNYRPGSRSGISSISKTGSFKNILLVCVGKCFAKGIKVLMYDGTHQNVEELNVGNQIMSKNYSAYSKIHGVNPIDSQISAVSWLVKSPTIYCQ
ncbi:hypothetical protein RhiirA4_481122 [Rhizophagus irregularis]|uniref:Uncharacterized protein n=1 Tax=Rhizophagus irregularis TaxID=588596 RepID=A0A2I1HJ21_9GLOM|nr:hypothetical protein RhiirA4_481122 [Rhizophagus irregularis]